jgi:hypothetical protein
MNSKNTSKPMKKTPTLEGNQYLSLAQLMEREGCCFNTLYVPIKEGKLPAIRQGTATFVRLADWEEFQKNKVWRGGREKAIFNPNAPFEPWTEAPLEKRKGRRKKNCNTASLPTDGAE